MLRFNLGWIRFIRGWNRFIRGWNGFNLRMNIFNPRLKVLGWRLKSSDENDSGPPLWFSGQEWIHFRVRNGSIFGSEMDPFSGQKWIHFRVKIDPFSDQKWIHCRVKNWRITQTFLCPTVRGPNQKKIGSPRPQNPRSSLTPTNLTTTKKEEPEHSFGKNIFGNF